MDKNDFVSIFLDNVMARSRTSQGISATNVSSSKKALLLTGDALRAQVKENAHNLASHIWQDQRLFVSPSSLKNMLERWYDTLHNQLYRGDEYHVAQAALKEKAELQEDKWHLEIRINNRYRAWTVSYVGEGKDILPYELETRMNMFYAELAWKLIEARRSNTYAPYALCAWADREMDFIIHPWADGCGRMSTALVMWISLRIGQGGFPRFRSKEEHYKTIRDEEMHFRYFRRCFR